MFLHRCVFWHGTFVSLDIVLLRRLTWYRCVLWHGTVLSLDMVLLCLLTRYRCVVGRGTLVSFDMVLLCRLTWYHCVAWHGTVFSHLFKMSGFFCTTVMWWLYSSANLSSNPVLSSASPHPRKIFPVLYSLCLIYFLCFYAQHLLRIKHAYCMKQCVVLSDLQLLLLRVPPEQVHFPIPVTWSRKQSGFTKRYVPIVC